MFAQGMRNETAARSGDRARPLRPRGVRVSERRWLVAWIGIVGGAETLGFLVPATVGVLASQSPFFIPLMLVAGAVEGTLLGWAQVHVLHGRIPALRRWAWVWLTVAGALVAYVAGFTPSSTADLWMSWPWVARIALLVGVGIVLLLSIGTAQWLELRKHLPRAAWWIAGTAVAWLVGLGLFFAIAPPLWHEGQPAAVAITIGVVAGLVMAAAMATITGVTLIALLRRAQQPDAAPQPAADLGRTDVASATNGAHGSAGR